MEIADIASNMLYQRLLHRTSILLVLGHCKQFAMNDGMMFNGLAYCLHIDATFLPFLTKVFLA